MNKLLITLLTFDILFMGFGMDYRIVGPEHPAPQETTAIAELTEYLAKRVSGHLTVGGKGGVIFHVGDTELARERHLLSTELADERWVVKSFGTDVVLNGGGTRGVLYAVYHFLEEQCGIAWWSESEEHVPQASALELDALDITGRPFFRYRNIYRGLKGTYERNRFMLRVRQNGDGMTPVDRELGGSIDYGPPTHAHTFDYYIPFKIHGKTHPEYYSLVKGQRVGGQLGGQLCLTNPQLKELFVEKLLAYVEQGKAEAAKQGLSEPRIYDISQNDNRNLCECEACQAAAREFNPSGVYLRFVNEIAEEVEKRHPGIYISTLMYHFTEEPPKGGVTARDNVIVKLTNTRTNKAASLLEPQNAFFRETVEKWSRICRNLIIWEYDITFTRNIIGLPYASELYYGDQFRFYAQNQVKGVFAEHEYPEKCDMFEYKFFLEAKLMEDPYQDAEALADFFLKHYYGAAAPFLKQYRRLLDKAARKADAQLRWTRFVDSFDFITEEDALECHRLFEEATKAVAGDETLVARVMRARHGLDRLTCLRTTGLIYHGPKTPSASQLDGAAAFRRLDEHWTAWCDAHFPEHQSWKEPIVDVLNQFRFYFNPPPAPEQFADRNYYEFVAVSSARGDYDPHNVWAAEEPDSVVGRGWRIMVDGDPHYSMPFAIGLYDKAKKTTVMRKDFAQIPENRGYNWFGLGKAVVIPEDGMLYITRAWTIQLHFNGMTEIIGRPFEIWVSARHLGRQFHPCQGEGGDRIIVDRILLVEPE